MQAAAADVWQARCHSASVHRRLPAALQAASASSCVRLVQGRALALEQARAADVPAPVVVASGRAASWA